ncbi:PAS domain S-box protein [Puia dinghuensis]|uniref:Oxygen sensor histidine kinase NreB n=1 Tax=Puia dinghuensis TaxID=1792502 RepID=A0A8J2UJN4_9BACT|nr:PAS domain S-box protein [Puia dinghuensis]GGB24447.1 histidine kinase [Puia dinghuensis]
MDGDIQPIRILVVEDNPGDLFLFKEFLQITNLPVAEIRHAASLAEAKLLLAIHDSNLVFLDLSLPDSYGLDSYTQLQPMTQRAAVILLTGLTDTKTALQALVMGAQDYLVKGDFDEKLLSRAIRYSLERIRSLQYLRESEERYRELFNNNPMPMWVFDARSFRFLEANEAAVQHYGYTQEEFFSRTLADIQLNGDAQHLLEEVEAVRHSREGIKKGILQHRKKNGELIFVDIAWHSISYKDQLAVLVLANDVTERIQLENELNEQRVTRQKQITEAVILAQEKERTEIGKELHDNVNQILGASNLYINTAMTDDEMRQELLERSTALVSKAINEIRKISKSLITPGLREIGLIESIEDVIDDMKFAKEDLAIELDLQNISEEQIEDRRKLTVFRIIQEQLNNIVKHARATRVLIRLSMEGDNIVVTVADNGVGFDVSRHRKGVGITNIISRTELFNGKVEIQSQPGEGCTLSVSLPT